MPATFESLEARKLLAATGAISGSVYADLNANAKHEAGEAGMKKVRVYLDANNNGVLDARTETSAATDKRGQFQFTGLSAGTYRLREVAAEGYRVVGPRSRWFKITLTEGQHVARRQFANARLASHGTGSGSELTGSTDFNGSVDFDDYSRIDPGFNNSTGWNNGDFDYNGVVEFDDFALIDQAFNTQSGTLDRAIRYLNGSDRSDQGMDTPPLQLIQDHLTQLGQGYADRFLATVAPPPAAAPSIKLIAKADFKLTHNDHSLLNAKSWLSGNKNVLRSPGLQTVIDHYHQYGIDYKRAFLKLAAGY